MAGSNIFVAYLTADGQNVTVSPRLGVGHVEPENVNGQGGQLTLLEGSGVADGVMTANVECTNCNSWSGGSMNFASNNGMWIYASKSGQAIQSDELNADISMHDDHGVFNWDFTTAKGGDTQVNPFVQSAANTATTTNAATEVSSGGLSDSYIIAHAVLACLAVAFVLPIGGILIRVANFPSAMWVHTGIQYLGLIMYIAAFGLGAYYASEENYWSNRHPIIGTVVFALMLTQPLWGIIHHRMYKKVQGRTISSYFHLTVGRVVILLGIINGGLGLQLGGVSTGAYAGYGVGAGIMGLAYILAILYGENKRHKARKLRSDSEGSYENGRKREAEMKEHE